MNGATSNTGKIGPEHEEASTRRKDYEIWEEMEMEKGPGTVRGKGFTQPASSRRCGGMEQMRCSEMIEMYVYM